MAIYKPKGRNVYVMDFTFKGRRIYESTGETSHDRAKRRHDKRLNELRDGKAGLRVEDRYDYLGQAAEAWQNAPRKHPWSASYREIVACGLKHLLPWFGKDRLLADISAKDIAEYQHDRLSEPKHPACRTINMEVGALRKILRFAGQWERLKDKVHMLHEREDVGRALTAEEEHLLLEECGRSVSRALLPFVTLALDTGARYDTIRTLQWGRVDLEKGLIKIGKDKTKAGTGRLVPLNARATETLRHWAAQFPERKPEHYVFPTQRFGLTGKRGTFGFNGQIRAFDTDASKPVGTIQSAWESAKRRTRRRCPSCTSGTLRDTKKTFRCSSCGVVLKELPEGLVRFRFHDLRHTAVSRMIIARVPLPIIAKVVGWKLGTVVGMAERYGHFEEDALRSAVDAISAAPKPYDSPYAKAARGESIQ